MFSASDTGWAARDRRLGNRAGLAGPRRHPLIRHPEHGSSLFLVALWIHSLAFTARTPSTERPGHRRCAFKTKRRQVSGMSCKTSPQPRAQPAAPSRPQQSIGYRCNARAPR